MVRPSVTGWQGVELGTHGPVLMNSDGTEEELSTEDLLRIRDLGKNDLYFFARGVLRYRDLVPRVHRDLCSYMEQDLPRSLVLMPRSHFKTTVGLAEIIRRIVRDPNLRILIANESAKNAQTMLEEIKQHVTRNEQFRALYDYVIPRNINETTWSREAILLPRTLIGREPTVSTIGVGGAVVSAHYNYMHFDDLIGEEALHSPAVMSRAISWLNHSVSLLIRPEEDMIRLVGTRWAYNDLYAHALSHMGFDVFRRKAVVLNKTSGKTEPLFRERFSLKFLASIMVADPQQWAAQYANDPSDVAFSDFQKEWLRYYTVAPDGDIRWTDVDGTLHKQSVRDLRIYVHVDPSVGDTPSADQQAVMTVGVNKLGQVFVLDAWQLRVDPIMLVEKLFELHERFSPRLFSIEATAFQKALAYFVEEEARRRSTYLRVEQHTPSSRKSKEARIRGALQPYFSSGLIFVRNTHMHFVEQYLAFGRTDEDHMMDALAQGPFYWKSPRDDSELARHSRIKSAMLMRRNYGLSGYGI